jgi:ABC-type transport system involved in cytochrome bd biosynthesis fused ATPase/permease subunit
VRARLRVWLPFVAAAVLIVATTWTGAILTWILGIAAIGLILDGLTLLWSRAGPLTGYRQ